MSDVREATEEERSAWDALVRQSPTGSFLQSWAWGEFQRAAGFRIRRLMLEDHRGAPRTACLLVEHALPFGQRYLYAPWGPVVDQRLETGDWRLETRDVGSLTGVLRAVREYVRGGPGLLPVYLRVEPKVPHNPSVILAVRRAGFTILGRGVQPKDTLVLDLTKSEDELLREMHPKTRYNIRLASRHGVTVKEQTTPDGLRVFLLLARDVERRGVFRYHPQHYYEAMLRTLGAVPGMVRLLVASHNGLPLAAGLLVTFGGTVTYAHGSSSTGHPHVMAPALLHWEAILRAKAAGARQYDFFGVAPRKPETGNRRPDSHPWGGVTRFKRGFGGREEHFVGIADSVLDPVRYRFYTIARGLRGLLHH